MSPDERFDVSTDPRLVVSVKAGRLDLYRSDGPITVSYQGDDVEVDQTGNTVTITSERKQSFPKSVRLNVGVPEGCDVDVSGASLDIHSDVDLGHFRVRTASGDISFDVAASLEVRSASGDVRFDSVTGDCDVTSASGDLFGGTVGGSLSGTFASGDVRVDQVDGRIQLKSASGDLRIGRTSAPSVDFKSMSGSVTVGVAPRTRVNFDASSLSGGIHVPEPSGDSQEEPLRVMTLRVKTVSGDIRLERAD